MLLTEVYVMDRVMIIILLQCKCYPFYTEYVGDTYRAGQEWTLINTCQAEHEKIGSSRLCYSISTAGICKVMQIIMPKHSSCKHSPSHCYFLASTSPS